MNNGQEYDELDGQTYEHLYARFIDERADDFWEAVGEVKGKKFLDLCAGTCRLTMRALNEGAEKVVAVDRSSSMAERSFRTSIEEFHHRLVIGDLPDALCLPDLYDNGPYDIVVCRQGVNYWMLTGVSAIQVASLMPVGGVFVFNSFAVRPSFQPTIKSRAWNGRQYVEVSWLDINCHTVHHVQIAESCKPHVSSFEYVAPDKWVDLMVKAGFSVETQFFNNGKSVLFRCVKK